MILIKWHLLRPSHLQRVFPRSWQLYNFAFFKQVLLSVKSLSHFRCNRRSPIMQKNDSEIWIRCLSVFPQHFSCFIGGSVAAWLGCRKPHYNKCFLFLSRSTSMHVQCTQRESNHQNTVLNRTIGTNGRCQNETHFTNGIPMNRVPFHSTQCLCIGQWPIRVKISNEKVSFQVFKIHWYIKYLIDELRNHRTFQLQLRS